jgi:putative colanic acid biosynthesis acetyltransferase WcaF
MTPAVDLALFDNAWYDSGRSFLIRILWLAFGQPLISAWFVPSPAKCGVLRLFGAVIGRKVVIKPRVRIKNPWRLRVGDNCWIGEECWIDNLADVVLEDSVCISQRAYLCTGNHDWTDPAFCLVVNPIRIRSGAWVGAASVVVPGVEIAEGGIAAAGSLVTRNVGVCEIVGGNPAQAIKHRRIGARPLPTSRRPLDPAQREAPVRVHGRPSRTSISSDTKS